MSRLLVAAGGGGDALAAVMVHAAVNRGEPAPSILTYAWERLRVDPVPGPRGRADFIGLRPVGERNAAVTPVTACRPPSASTLPRLAAEIESRLLLIDPTGGAHGIHDQVVELVDRDQVERVQVVDVGGDALARGDEERLRSPLADLLVVAACAKLPVPAELLITGPGVDGELSPEQVMACLAALGGQRVARLDAGHAALVADVLTWHPSEATALLAAAAQGRRGIVEVRDHGCVVQLAEQTADVYRVDLRAAYEAGLLAPALASTRSLTAAEEVIRRSCGESEIDYERRKASRLTASTAQAPDIAELIQRADAFTDHASRRGVDFVTYRRLAEAIAGPAIDHERLRADLRRARPQQDVPPLWSTRPPHAA